MSRVKNATFVDIRKHVQDKVEFDSTTGNLFSCIYSYGNRSNKRYVVFSYGGIGPCLSMTLILTVGLRTMTAIPRRHPSTADTHTHYHQRGRQSYLWMR